MKRLLWTLTIALLPSLVLAKGNHPMGGCGLGYLLLANKDNDKVTQVLGATTNGTFGNQTFGITSGTSGCTEDGALKIARETQVFAEVNLDTLRREMAAGEGEFVNTFAALLGATSETRPAMVRFLHENYQELFPAAETDSAAMLGTLTERLSQHPELLG